MNSTSSAAIYANRHYNCHYKTRHSSSSAAIYANRHYLELYHTSHPDRLAKNGPGKPQVRGDVYIHPSAQVHESAVVSKLNIMDWFISRRHFRGNLTDYLKQVFDHVFKHH